MFAQILRGIASALCGLWGAISFIPIIMSFDAAGINEFVGSFRHWAFIAAWLSLPPAVIVFTTEAIISGLGLKSPK